MMEYGSNAGGGGGGGSHVPQVQRPIVWLLLFGGATAFALSAAAEATRTATYQVLENAYQQLVCSYKPSPATALASVATAVLFITQVVAILAGGFAWYRPLVQRHSADNKAVVGRAVQRVLVVFIMNMIFLMAALALLIAAAVENQYHVSSVPYGEGLMYCSTVSEGLFLSAAFLTAITAVLAVAYYVYAVRAAEELWVSNYVAAPVVVDMEAFSRETARTSITSIISDKRRPGHGGGGVPAAISNTPVTDARLA